MATTPRSMLKCAVVFGMVTVPVTLHAGLDSHTSGAHRLHETCLDRVRQRIWCGTCDCEVPRIETVRGFEVAPDRWVALSEEELASLPVRTLHTIEVAHFVPVAEAVRLEAASRQPYYLAPEKLGRRAFALLCAALEDTALAAIAKITIREREHLATVRPLGDGLLLTTLAWPDEIRPIGSLDLPGHDDVPETELRLARELLRAMTRPFEPTEHRDEYAAALRALVEAKAEGAAFTLPDAPPSAALVDLMAALQASVAAVTTPAAKPGRTPRRTAARRAKEVAVSVA